MTLRARISAFCERDHAILDKPLQWLWPSSRGDVEYPIYAHNVAHLYQAPGSQASGSILIAILFASLTFRHELPDAFYWLLAAFVPISIGRYFQLRAFNALPLEMRLAKAHRREARYAISSLIVTLTITGMLAFSLPELDYSETLTVTLVIAAYSSGIASRNATHPYLVTILVTTIITPIVYALLGQQRFDAAIMAAFALAFALNATKTSRAIMSHTVDAMRHARSAERSANFDAVTQLPNRRNFMSRLNETLISEPNVQHAVITLDLDQFKRVNDTRGHAVGDELLIMAAARIEETAKAFDANAVVSRFGGDEFVVLTNADTDEAIARTIVARLREPFELSTDKLSIGGSAGICRTDGPTTMIDLLRKSDIALYEAKETGRNRYVLFNDALGAKASARSRTEERFQQALSDGSLTLAFQPIVKIDTGEIIAAEALARWTDPELGTVPPAIFVKIAEQTGLINKMSELLLNKACMSAASWPSPIPVAFNVSVQQLQNGPLLIQQVLDALETSGLPAHRLELEITESTLIRSFEEIAPTIAKLRDHGLRIALDDFGSGYCSLAYLNKITFDKIKIDQELAAQASRSKTQASIIRMIASIGADLGADVVVEGIEDEGSAVHMRHLGISLAQGYYFGRPASARVLSASLYDHPEPRRKGKTA